MTTQNIPKVCTWHTFYNRAWAAGLIEPVFENILGVVEHRVHALAKAEGLTLYIYNPTGRYGNAVGTYRSVRQTRAFWYDLLTRAGVTFTGEIN